jgi:hypothetical protein
MTARNRWLSPAAYRVRQFMLDRLQRDRLFNDTTSYIAKGTGLSLITVKLSRKALRDLGYWNTKELPTETRSLIAGTQHLPTSRTPTR